MRRFNFLTGTMVVLATLGLCLPPVALSSPPVTAPRVADVALSDGNVLVGQVVDSSGAAVAKTHVLLQRQEKAVLAMRTNKQGFFAAKGVSAGVYRLMVADSQMVYRLWAPRTAPPSAQRGALIVIGNPVVRGQYGPGLRNMLANPWVVGGIVAAAVAIPIAIHNANDNSPGSP